MAGSRPDEAGPANDPSRTGWTPHDATPPSERGYGTFGPASYPAAPSGDFVDPNLPPPYAATPYSFAPSYPTAQYSSAPPGYGYPGGPYPPPNPYGYDAPGSGRPGTLTAASVLSYVQAGLLLIAMLMLFYGASIVNNFDEASTVTAELLIDGVVNAVLAGLFIWGGVAMSLRRATGRVLVTAAGALCVVDGIYWMTRFPSGVVAFYMILFIALPATAAGLAWSTIASSWLTAEPGRP
jgi:hypothetical protein